MAFRKTLKWLDRAGFELCVLYASSSIYVFLHLIQIGQVVRTRDGSKPARDIFNG